MALKISSETQTPDMQFIWKLKVIQQWFFQPDFKEDIPVKSENWVMRNYCWPQPLLNCIYLGVNYCSNWSKVANSLIFSWRMQVISCGFGGSNLQRSRLRIFSKWLSRRRNWTQRDWAEELQRNFQLPTNWTRMHFLHWKYLLRLQSNDDFLCLSHMA